MLVSARLRRILRALAMVVAVVIVAVACSSPGNPTGFDDQSELSDDGLSTVERNWLEGCEPALSENNAADAAQVCQCSYDRIVQEMSFEDFVEADELLRDNPETLQEQTSTNQSAHQLVLIVRDCIAG